jgi:hypothetical protein
MKRDVAEQGVNCSQTDIATAGTDAPIFLQVIQEDPYERSIQVPNCQRRWLLSKPLAGELQEQAEGIPVACDRVRA